MKIKELDKQTAKDLKDINPRLEKIFLKLVELSRDFMTMAHKSGQNQQEKDMCFNDAFAYRSAAYIVSCIVNRSYFKQPYFKQYKKGLIDIETIKRARSLNKRFQGLGTAYYYLFLMKNHMYIEAEANNNPSESKGYIIYASVYNCTMRDIGEIL